MFSEYFKPTFHYSRAVEGGIYRRNEASFGPETWFGLFGSVLLGVRQTRQAMAPQAVSDGPFTYEVLPGDGDHDAGGDDHDHDHDGGDHDHGGHHDGDGGHDDD
jgi:hypothetical protein